MLMEANKICEGCLQYQGSVQAEAMSRVAACPGEDLTLSGVTVCTTQQEPQHL